MRFSVYSSRDPNNTFVLLEHRSIAEVHHVLGEITDGGLVVHGPGIRSLLGSGRVRRS